MSSNTLTSGNVTLDLKPGESNRDYCMRRAAEMDKDELIRGLLRQIKAMGKRRRYKLPLWSYIGEATGHGSGISNAIVVHYLGSCDV